MTNPTQQIKPGLVFKRSGGRNTWTYRVTSDELTAGSWLVQVIDLNGRATNGGTISMNESIIRAAMSKGETK